MSRPYGVALLIAGVDETGPHVFQTDPSGTYLEWQARAIGSGGETAMTYIKETYHSNMTLKEAEKMSLQVLKNVMEEKIDSHNVELMEIKCSTKQMQFMPKDYVEGIIKELS